MTVGARIKARRLELGMSADDLAYRIGKNRSTVYRYENGDIDSLPMDVLDQIAEALETTPKYLMGWTTDCYDYQRDPDARLSEIGSEALRHLMSVYNHDPEAVWNAYVRASEPPDESEWPAEADHDKPSKAVKELRDLVDNCTEEEAVFLLRIVKAALALDD